MKPLFVNSVSFAKSLIRQHAIKRLLLLTVAFNGLTSISYAANLDGYLDPIEQQLVKQVDQDLDQSLDLLKRSVNINSGTMNFAGVKQVGDLFAEQLQQLGLTTRWVPGAEFQRAGHLFAEGGSAKGPKILMIGHLDTVFSKDSPVQHYQPIDEKFIKGPGIIDMKGGDVMIVYVLKALKAAGLLDKFGVQVVMMGDEEKRGRPMALATKVLVDAAKWADIALGYENGDGDPKTAVVSRRGYTGWQLTVTGKPMHSSQIFREDIGYGSIYETARILNEFRTALASEPNLTFNPGLIIGGTEATIDKASARATGYGKENVIAKTTLVAGDLRALSPQQQQKAQQAMTAIVAKNLPHTSASISFDPGYPAMEPTAKNHQLLAMYSQASEDLGFGPVTAVDPRRAGAADISFTAEYVDMALDGLGLMGHSSHTDDETADITTLAQQTKRSAILIYRLIKTNSPHSG